MYGRELILDLHECDPRLFNRKDITTYFIEVCDLIDMKRGDLHFWDDVGVEEKQTEPHLKGTSDIQFITTSNITIHTLDILETVHLNIFSCENFHGYIVEVFSVNYFKGYTANMQEIDRI